MNESTKASLNDLIQTVKRASDKALAEGCACDCGRGFPDYLTGHNGRGWEVEWGEDEFGTFARILIDLDTRGVVGEIECDTTGTLTGLRIYPEALEVA